MTILTLIIITSCSTPKKMKVSENAKMQIELALEDCNKNFYNQAWCAFDQQDFPKAIFYGNKSKKNNSLLNTLLGISYFYLGNYSQSIELLKKAQDKKNLHHVEEYLNRRVQLVGPEGAFVNSYIKADYQKVINLYSKVTPSDHNKIIYLKSLKKINLQQYYVEVKNESFKDLQGK